jgi:hypothetical protein
MWPLQIGRTSPLENYLTSGYRLVRLESLARGLDLPMIEATARSKLNAK